ncbi:MAG: SUMF1/EgtB/PvdO family nonheme iron enzyme, partial [Oxalobacteraceae bacterium]
GGTLMLGSAPQTGFVFDNEKWAHPVPVPAFNIDATLVSNAQYSEFIADGGYQKADFWSAAGRAWLMQQDRSAPRYWQRDGHAWCTERFARLTALPAQQAVRHVTLFEAQAYCRWAGRRLPSESEWEYAALAGHPAFQWGGLWEWTGTPFAPYPGFVADAYQEYSAPWFGTHQALRGASFATRPRMRWPKFRNFYVPQRDDVFVGFRTCAA